MSYSIIFETKICKLDNGDIIHFSRQGCNNDTEGRTRDDLAMIIEELLQQRYQGVKNEKGAWVTPAFPKLLYVLEEDNIILEF